MRHGAERPHHSQVIAPLASVNARPNALSSSGGENRMGWALGIRAVTGAGDRAVGMLYQTSFIMYGRELQC